MNAPILVAGARRPGSNRSSRPHDRGRATRVVALAATTASSGSAGRRSSTSSTSDQRHSRIPSRGSIIPHRGPTTRSPMATPRSRRLEAPRVTTSSRSAATIPHSRPRASPSPRGPDRRACAQDIDNDLPFRRPIVTSASRPLQSRQGAGAQLDAGLRHHRAGGSFVTVMGRTPGTGAGIGARRATLRSSREFASPDRLDTWPLLEAAIIKRRAAWAGARRGDLSEGLPRSSIRTLGPVERMLCNCG